MPRLQLALDMTDLDRALEVADKVAQGMDVLEAGTILCAAQGMNAVSGLKNAHPEKEVVADLRIVRAGKAMARLALQAGADVVTCVAEAPVETMKAAIESAKDAGGKIELELREDWDISDCENWRQLGINDVICHNGVEISSLDGQDWGKSAQDKVREIAEAGLTVSIAGGITLENAASLRKLPIDKVICGKAIWDAADPEGAASQLVEALAN